MKKELSGKALELEASFWGKAKEDTREGYKGCHK